MEDLFDIFDDVDDIVEKEKKPKEKKKEEAVKVAKKEKEEAAVKVAKKEKIAKNNAEKRYRYPFKLYLAARFLETDSIFEEEKEYSESEITKLMLEHGYYEFAGKVTFDFRENENVLIPIFYQHKKG